MQLCPKCKRNTLSLPTEASGMNNDILNYRRKYQTCDCGYFHWNQGKTALEDIPDDVKMQFAMRSSLKTPQPSETHVLCGESNCQTNSNQRRRANKECGHNPVLCANCCKAKGGCPVHRCTTRDVPSVSGSSTTTAVDTPDEPRRYFARPLDSEYARPYIQAHQHRFLANSRVEEDAKLKDIEDNTFTAVVWKKDAPAPAELFRLVADQHKFAPANFPAIMQVAQNGLIAVLDSVSLKWVNHDIRLPIPVNCGLRILLRAIDVVDCAEFEAEISSLPPVLSAPISSTSSVVPTALPEDDSDDPVPVDPPPSVKAEPKKFPLKYTCDMRKPMAGIAGIAGRDKIEGAFMEAFPGIPYKSKTVYKHLRFYRQGLTHGFIEKFAAHGRTPSGRWNEMVSALKAVKTGKRVPLTLAPTPKPEPRVIDLTQGRASRAEIQSVINDVDAGMQGPQNVLVYDGDKKVCQMKMSHFRVMNGVLQDYSPDEPLSTFEIWEEYHSGTRFKVHMSNFTRPSHPTVDKIACVFKDLPAQDNHSTTVWIEGARSAECKAMWEYFQTAAVARGIKLPDIDFAATALLTNNVTGLLSLTQPFYHGVRVPLSSLVADFWDALSAFSHWTYKWNDYNSVYVDFEGLLSGNGYRIFDSRTHIIDLNKNRGFDFMTSQGEQGVREFRDSHNCNSICSALGLGPLPLVFPPPPSMLELDEGDRWMLGMGDDDANLI
ncbi:hypothetical protein MVEN_00502100 [Mycena venus]|uniref:Alpha-type protein kinase domain-containing protein n=1 Tax=Mycena venus TaxID=2733690 RepID=A0A8H6YWK2_9AGAR|nr:hypothetical protein MVEN_00502100 [Mycena venus]